MGNETVANAKTANKATASGDSVYFFGKTLTCFVDSGGERLCGPVMWTIHGRNYMCAKQQPKREALSPALNLIQIPKAKK